MIQLNVGERFMSPLFNFLELIMLALGKKYALMYTVFIFAFHPTLCINRGFLKSKRKKRAHCGRHYRNQQQTASCLEVSSENR